jgi:hypothetical protein
MSNTESTPVTPPPNKKWCVEVPLTKLPLAKTPNDNKFHGGPAIRYYSTGSEYRRADYFIRQHLPKKWYITIVIQCIEEVRAGHAEIVVKYCVYMKCVGDKRGLLQDSNMVHTIPDLLRTLRSYKLPSYAISRACLPPKVNMYQSTDESGQWTFKPLADFTAIWWSFYGIRTILDKISEAQAHEGAAPPPLRDPTIHGRVFL